MSKGIKQEHRVLEREWIKNHECVVLPFPLFFLSKNMEGEQMIEIKNLRKGKPENPWDVKLDRSSWFGNRFIMKSESERDMVCDQYEKWFHSELYDSAMQAELAILEDTYEKYGKLNLFCWCWPKRCHAETIKRYLESKYTHNENALTGPCDTCNNAGWETMGKVAACNCCENYEFYSPT